MKIDKALLEKIIKLRDLRQAISNVRKSNVVKKKEDASPANWPKPDLSPEAKQRMQTQETHSEMRSPNPSGDKPYGLKHLGIKKLHSGVIHMIGIPGHNRHYEINVDKMAPRIEHTTKLVTSEGSTLSRSPSVHHNMHDAVEDVAHHFNTREWKRK